MGILQNKIDFTLLVKVVNANPNGDPLNGNRPRTTYTGQGEISDVCIKRKIRNRLQDMGESVFVQSAERSEDGYSSLSERASGNIKKYESVNITISLSHYCIHFVLFRRKWHLLKKV